MMPRDSYWRLGCSVITIRAMKLIGLMVIALVGCTNSANPAPDAVTPLAHDIQFFKACDRAWDAVDGAATLACADACMVKPVNHPCIDSAPCDNGPACTGATDDSSDVVVQQDCASTFTFRDVAGSHVGCCQIRTTSTNKSIPSFYECPAP